MIAKDKAEMVAWLRALADAMAESEHRLKRGAISQVRGTAPITDRRGNLTGEPIALVIHMELARDNGSY